MQVKVLFARFPYGGVENHHFTDWFVKTVADAKADRRVSAVHHVALDNTPITMTRNRVLEQALKMDVDIVCMADSDMVPDLPLPGAKPFWKASFDFLLKHRPCVIAAPYCGPPPTENVYVFQFANRESDNPNDQWTLDQYSRSQAAQMAGIQRAAALPTGLILIDMEAVKRLPRPTKLTRRQVLEKFRAGEMSLEQTARALEPGYFYYTWTDGTASEKSGTEDVTFSRDLALAGVPLYCNWDAWAGHLKRKCVGKPNHVCVDDIADKLREAMERNRLADEVLVEVGAGEPIPPEVEEFFAGQNGVIPGQVAADRARAVTVNARDENWSGSYEGGRDGGYEG